MTSLTVLRQIAPSARVDAQATIGAYCVVGPEVTIGPGTVLKRRVSVTGRTTIGSDNVFAEGCVLGADPQDLKYAGGATLLIIGHRNRFARNVTAHIGTEAGGHVTRIGDDNVLDEGAHVAHDCYVDDGVYLGRGVLLAGHVHAEDGAVIEDLAGAHHFTTIGRYARVGPHTPVRRDVPPYTDFYSREPGLSPPTVRGIHEPGIRAAKLTAQAETELRHTLSELFDDESALGTKIEQLINLGAEGESARVCEFCQRSLRGIFGRYRELFRGKAPPEAEQFAPPE